MSKIYFKILLSALAGLLVTAQGPSLRAAESSDDVFLDEGDSDFDPLPIPSADERAVDGFAETPSAEEPDSKSQVSAKKEKQETFETPMQRELFSDEPVAEGLHKDKTSEDTKSARTSKKEAAAKNKRGAASAGQFLVTKTSCPMLKDPKEGSQAMLTVSPGRKLWVENAETGWVRGFNRAGEPGYINRNCFE